jgi:branched-chain amino acid transport system substrate-binding protein
MIRALAVLAVLATGAAAPGVTPTRIAIGSSGPLTGEASAQAGILRGADAYFKYVNGRGGVNGRTIDFTYLDDASDASRTADNVRRLVEQDHVLALFSIVGTEPNLAVRAYTTAAGVPQLFSASAATTLGRDYARYPLEMGYCPPFAEEGEIYARSILATNPKKARIAVLYQNDAYGNDLLQGFRKGLGARGSLIVRTAGYESTAADVDTEVDELKQSGANTLAIFAFGKFATQAFAEAARLGWAPQTYVNAVAAAPSIMKHAPQKTAEGAISILWAKEPGTTTFATDSGVALAQKIAGIYIPGGSRVDGFEIAGMAEAVTMVDAIAHAGKALTRKSLMASALRLDEANNPFLAPGVTVHTTPTSRFPVSSVQLQRWHAGRWVPFGGVQSAGR